MDTTLAPLSNGKRERAKMYYDKCGFHPNQLIQNDDTHTLADGLVKKNNIHAQVSFGLGVRTLYNAGLIKIKPRDFQLWRISKKYEELVDGELLTHRNLTSLNPHLP